MRTGPTLLFLAILLLACAPANAGPQPSWRFDQPNCSIQFAVTHILAKIPGRFERFGGGIALDPANPANGRIDIAIDVASLATGDPRRNRMFLSGEFLDVSRYPQIRFRSQEIVPKGGNAFVAVGDLTIKDVTKRVEIPFTFAGTRASPVLKNTVVAGFSARFAIDRLEYHVGSGKQYRMGTLGKDVDVEINLELQRSK